MLRSEEQKEGSRYTDQMRDRRILENIFAQIKSFYIRLPLITPTLDEITRLITQPAINVGALRTALATILNSRWTKDYYHKENVRQFAITLHTLTLLLAKYAPNNNTNENNEIICPQTYDVIPNESRVLLGLTGYQIDNKTLHEGEEKPTLFLDYALEAELKHPCTENPVEREYLTVRADAIRLNTNVPEIPEIIAPSFCDYWAAPYHFRPVKFALAFGGASAFGTFFGNLAYVRETTGDLTWHDAGDTILPTLGTGILGMGVGTFLNVFVIQPTYSITKYTGHKCCNDNSTLADNFFSKLITARPLIAPQSAQEEGAERKSGPTSPSVEGIRTHSNNTPPSPAAGEAKHAPLLQIVITESKNEMKSVEQLIASSDEKRQPIEASSNSPKINAPASPVSPMKAPLLGAGVPAKSEADQEAFAKREAARLARLKYYERLGRQAKADANIAAGNSTPTSDHASRPA